MYKCSECSYNQKKYFGLCPICRSGVGEESFSFHEKNYNKQLNFQKVNPNEKTKIAKRKTQYQSFNALLSSSQGFIENQVVLLGAEPGVGKSTLCTSISDKNTLYISSEENFSQVNQRNLRVNKNSNSTILIATEIEDVIQAIETCEEEFIIIDSLNSIEFGVGYQTVALFANQITKAIKNNNKIGIIVSQVAKNGEISGMNSIIHIVDTVLYLERSEISSHIIATSTKNRYGEIGSVAIFNHLKDGFEEVNMDHMEVKKEIGATYTETRFGHKNMTIAIEALVSRSQSNYGIKKSNGYNFNRFTQVLGVLSYFGKYDFNNKDIYIAVSNGLYTDDTSIELALANSILSSLYNKQLVKEAIGQIRLNGKVLHGFIDGNKIEHISELINLYK